MDTKRWGCAILRTRIGSALAYYYGMITQIDANIGRSAGDVARAGELDNTIIVFTADHGENLGDHRLLFKGTTYDCVTNVPAIVSWPGHGRSGVERDLLLQLDRPHAHPA